jgi:hypothetical protein
MSGQRLWLSSACQSLRCTEYAALYQAENKTLTSLVRQYILFFTNHSYIFLYQCLARQEIFHINVERFRIQALNNFDRRAVICGKL